MTASSTSQPTATRIADSIPITRRIGPRTVVSSLWLFVILNYLYADVLGLYWTAHVEEILAGEVAGIPITQQFLLGASVLMTIPMASVLISRIAPHRFARWSSVAAGAVMTLVQVGSLTFGDNTWSYLYFSVIEITTTVAITWYAATRWRVDS